MSACLGGTLVAQKVDVTPAAPAPTVSTVIELAPFKVSGSRASASDVGGTTPTDNYSAEDIDNSGAFDLGEFLGQLPPSPNGKEQLVLIDGEPTYLDISTLPPEMIQGIEVSNYGAMPQYGAFAKGRVINIRLKQNYRGANVTLNYRNSLEGGGGAQKGVTLSGGATQGKNRLIFTLNYKEQTSLFASERSFSSNQNHEALGGTDLRLLWGERAVVQAVAGNLAGIVDASGNPVPVALVPETGIATAPAQFLAGQIRPPFVTLTAAGQRRFDTADYLMLVSPSEQTGINLNFSRPLNKATRFSVAASLNETRSGRISAPPVTPSSAGTRVAAAFNPFGQDVLIGLVHTGFGPVQTHSESTNAQFGINLAGQFTGRWKWNTSLGTRWSDVSQSATDLDLQKFSASLNAADPALRFNPFGDDARNAVLYPALTVVRSNDNTTLNSKLEVSASGPAFAAPGGDANLVLRGNYSDQLQERTYRNARGLADSTINRHPNSESASATLMLPWFSETNARRALRRLETEFTSNFSDRSSVSPTTKQRAGLVWSPAKPLMFQGSYAASWVAPIRYVAEEQALVTATLIDPHRSSGTASEVQVTSRDFDGTAKARTEEMVFSASIEPTFLDGLQLTVTYDEDRQHDLASSRFEAQDLIYNEAAFPTRITRAMPNAADLALGEPGTIIAVDTTPVEGGEKSSSGLSLSVEYRKNSESLGHFRFSISARHPLTSTYEIQPGVPFLFERDTEFNPPDWTTQTRLSWSKGPWQISTHVRYTDEIISPTFVTPPTTEIDLRFGYKFRKDIVRGWGKGAQLGLSLDNFFTGDPRFADTLTGFRSGSALGKTYSLTLKIPLNS
ncbi:hypothetical protein [Oleiharenicola lentus]|uniref:hypothetical protein n=1 Tax=Oleiharenicola lentus TaxID=2508720 RepID=UPI003F670228